MDEILVNKNGNKKTLLTALSVKFLFLLYNKSMKTSGAFAVSTNSVGQILLVKRRDFPLWDLPGGRVEKHESIERAAIRESFEETGFHVKILRLTGSYFNPELADTQFIFLGTIIGGTSIGSGPETTDVRFFSPNHLPLFMIPHRKKQIYQALTGPSVPIQAEIHDSWLVKYMKKH